MNKINQGLQIISVILVLFFCNGCSTIQYYTQSISGQLEVSQRSREISRALSDETVNQATQDKLKTVLEIRRFSINELGLPDNASYLAYADLGRDYVVWNIFAAEEFSLEPKQWCFLFVGCLNYRGYFKESDAREFEAQLKEQGLETYLGGVSAYSTLGWFDDPVLNTMLKWSDARMANVIFHELTHQLIYVKNDTEFNESLADAVGIIGVRKWLRSSSRYEQLEVFENYLSREKSFVNLILRFKPEFEVLYKMNLSRDEKYKRKQALIAELKQEYGLLRQQWDRDYYGNWMEQKLNNASIASIVSYRKYMDAFMSLYQQSGGNITEFLSKMVRLSNCEQKDRDTILTNQNYYFSC